MNRFASNPACWRALGVALLVGGGAPSPALAQAPASPSVQAAPERGATRKEASPVGVYDVAGTEAEGESFRGVVQVEQAGELYRVTWTLEGESYAGIGMLTNGVFAAVVEGEERPQLAVYTADGAGGWSGKWAELGDQLAGSETWTRK